MHSFTIKFYIILQISCALSQFGDDPFLSFNSINDDRFNRGDDGGPSANFIPDLRAFCNSPAKDCSCSNPYRTIDGSCNNVQNPKWGSGGRPLLRFLKSAYGDGVSTFRLNRNGNELPNARLISLNIHGLRDLPNNYLNVIGMQWGQLIDHDLTFVPVSKNSDGGRLVCCGADSGNPQCASINVRGDRFYSQFKVVCLGFARSVPSNQSLSRTRIPTNQMTSYIDGSFIYGSDQTKANFLRAFRNGLLITNESPVPGGKPILPLVQDPKACDGQEKNNSKICAVGGEPRANENTGLTILQIIWLREHNRIATQLGSLNPGWSDEKIYQETRKIVGAMIQHITYSEYLPLILGPDAMRDFDLAVMPCGYFLGYDPRIEAMVHVEFSDAAYRYGHSLIPPFLNCLDANYEVAKEPLLMRDAMLNPLMLYRFDGVNNLIDCYLRGMVADSAANFDQVLTAEVRNHLLEFGNVKFGMDLGALNTMRGRDHGIPGYVEARLFCGLKPIRQFNDLFGVVPNATVQAVRSIYQHVNDMDLFPLGLAEIPVSGAILGPTFICLLGRQFRNLKFGDSFWYENSVPRQVFTKDQLAEIRKVTFAKVLCQNADDISWIQRKIFLVAEAFLNPLTECAKIPTMDLSKWQI